MNYEDFVYPGMEPWAQTSSPEDAPEPVPAASASPGMGYDFSALLSPGAWSGMAQSGQNAALGAYDKAQTGADATENDAMGLAMPRMAHPAFRTADLIGGALAALLGGSKGIEGFLAGKQAYTQEQNQRAMQEWDQKRRAMLQQAAQQRAAAERAKEAQILQSRSTERVADRLADANKQGRDIAWEREKLKTTLAAKGTEADTKAKQTLEKALLTSINGADSEGQRLFYISRLQSELPEKYGNLDAKQIAAAAAATPNELATNARAENTIARTKTENATRAGKVDLLIKSGKEKDARILIAQAQASLQKFAADHVDEEWNMKVRRSDDMHRAAINAAARQTSGGGVTPTARFTAVNQVQREIDKTQKDIDTLKASADSYTPLYYRLLDKVAAKEDLTDAEQKAYDDAKATLLFYANGIKSAEKRRDELKARAEQMGAVSPMNPVEGGGFGLVPLRGGVVGAGAPSRARSIR